MNGYTANYSFSIYCEKYFIGEEWKGEFSMFSNFEILLFLLPFLTSLNLFDKKDAMQWRIQDFLRGAPKWVC